jgi:GntR family transcriptional regulator / MocR family aminotransferase
VTPGLSGALERARKRSWKAPIDRSAEHDAGRVTVAPFQLGLPAVDAFPSALWARLATRRARVLTVEAMTAANPAGYLPLREAIASYLAVSRGILCRTEQVIVTSGFQGALGLISRAFFQPGEEVWFEDPGYFLARQGLEAAGAQIVPIPVDAAGLDVAAAAVRAPRARFAYLTPAHQAPLGVSLSLPRRLAILSWATRSRAWIIEDDYDSEFRYGSRPLPALKSLDEAGRVLYVGTFSKVLFPGLRLGYLVVPETEIDRVIRVCQLLYGDGPMFVQGTVADFMSEGHFARHIKRMRALYEERRAALVAALARVFEGRLTVDLQAGGMHLIGRSPAFRNDRDIVALARAQGLEPASLSRWYIEQGRRENGLLLSFTNIAPASAGAMAMRLRRAIELHWRSEI